MVSALDRKLLRDCRRLGGQIITIALVMASGIAVFISALAAYHSLQTSQARFYEESRFADIFLRLKRAPLPVADRIAEIPGIAQYEPRLVFDVIIDLPGVSLPLSGRMIGLPADGRLRINKLRLLAGRDVATDRLDEILVTQGFAEGNALRLGDAVSALLNGRKHRFQIVGVVASPEYVFSVAPGEALPDDKRYGVFYVAHDALAHAFAMEGAFNDVVATLSPGANARSVEAALDQLFARWGGLVAHGRSQQPSHRQLMDEVRQQGTMATTIPPVFLLVSAFLLRVVMGRLVASQREQIATLKALGYGSEISWHFAKFAVIVAALGAVVGVALGIATGQAILATYRPFFRFPEFTYDVRLWTPLAATALAFVSGVGGALAAVREVGRLRPAEAMRPPAPPAYTSRDPRFWRAVPARWMMAIRGVMAHPLRAGLTLGGIVTAAPLILLSIFWTDALNNMIDVQLAATDRSDAVLTFAESMPPRVTDEVRRLPGVIFAEPIRTAPVRLRVATRSYETGVFGLSGEQQLRRVLDERLTPIDLKSDGLLMSRRLSEKLGLRSGGQVDVEFLEGRRLRRETVLAGTVNDLIGVSAYSDRNWLDRFLQEDRHVSAVLVRLDATRTENFYAAVKQTPKIATVSFTARAMRNFRDTTGAVVLLMAGFFTLFAITIAFGVVYNSARIAYHEHALELATLRILGFTKLETARLLFAEIIVEIALAVPIGLVLGRSLVRLLLLAFETEMFEIPAAIGPASYVLTALFVLVATIASMIVIGRQLWRFDLISVLKTRA